MTLTSLTSYVLPAVNALLPDSDSAQCSEDMLKGWAEDKGNDKTADEMFDAYVKFYNECFKRPDDMHLGIHLCRGNYVGSRHFSEGAYDNIAKKLFTGQPLLII